MKIEITADLLHNLPGFLYAGNSVHEAGMQDQRGYGGCIQKVVTYFLFIIVTYLFVLVVLIKYD